MSARPRKRIIADSDRTVEAVHLKPQAGPAIVRLVLAAILLAAAGLKTHQLATQPVIDGGLMDSRAVLIVQVECEILLGLWLLSGAFVGLAWLVTTGLFIVFAAVSYFKAVKGDASCGCFGVVKVSPWITLIMDVMAVAALLSFRRGFWLSAPASRVRLRIAGASVAALALATAAAAAALSFEAATIDSGGQIIGSGKWVLLEPETWTGKRMPITQYLHMEKADELAKGKWAVILYRHDCPHCREELGKMRESLKGIEPPRTAFVELPPYGTGRAAFLPDGKNLLFGKLDDSKSWLVETPVMLTINEGVVGPLPAGAKPSSDAVLAASEAAQKEVKVTGQITMRVSQKKAFCDLRFAMPNSLQDVTVSLENDTKTEFRIRKGISECVCMKGIALPASIPAGQKASFKIRFHAPKDPMRYAKNLALVPADGGEPVLLGVHARVGMPLTAEPAVMDLGTLVVGEERIMPLTIRNDQDKPVRPVYGTSGLAGCFPRVPRGSAEPGGTVVIPVSVKATGTPGTKAEGQVQIQTNCQTQPTVSCRIFYLLSKQYSLSVGKLDLGDLTPSASHVASLRISSNSPAEGFVTSVTSVELKGAAFENSRVEYGPGWAEIHLTLKAGSSPADAVGKLQIGLAGHDQPVIVPIIGRIGSGAPVAAKVAERTKP